MKYIKLFESFDASDYGFSPDNQADQEKVDEIKDIFQDYIDEYNLEPLPMNLNTEDFDDVANKGLYYDISGFYDGINQFIIQIDIYIQSKNYLPYSKDNVIEDWISSKDERNIYWKLFFQLYEELTNFVKRINAIGYEVRYSDLRNNFSLSDLIYNPYPFKILIKEKLNIPN